MKNMADQIKLERLERIVEFSPAFDRRSPEPSKNYGIHCVELRMVVKGEKGAVQFLLFTGWDLPHVKYEMKMKGWPLAGSYPMPVDLGYHSYKPMYEDQEPQSGGCKYLDGAPCYYDGSGLNARPVYDLLVSEGGDAVWKYLEDYYNSTFKEKKNG